MRILKAAFFFFVLMIVLPKISSGQDTARYKVQENFKREIVINDKRFRVYNNWFSGGGGVAVNTGIPYVQTVIAVNLNFHVKRYYFRLGGMMSGNNFGQWNNYQLHGGWVPYRKETEKYNLAFVAALSYATGYKFVAPPDVFNTARPYATVGGYAEVQYIHKIYYDAGIGGAFFVNVNDQNAIIGIRADLFLSGAYKGYVKGKEPHKAM